MFALAMLASQAMPASRPEPVSKREVVQSVAVTCSSGRRFSATFSWRFRAGITMTEGSGSDGVLPDLERDKIAAATAGATDLNHVTIYCSGSSDIGINIAYVRRLGEQVMPTLLSIDVSGTRITYAGNTERALDR